MAKKSASSGACFGGACWINIWRIKNHDTERSASHYCHAKRNCQPHAMAAKTSQIHSAICAICQRIKNSQRSARRFVFPRPISRITSRIKIRRNPMARRKHRRRAVCRKQSHSSHRLRQQQTTPKSKRRESALFRQNADRLASPYLDNRWLWLCRAVRIDGAQFRNHNYTIS